MDIKRYITDEGTGEPEEQHLLALAGADQTGLGQAERTAFAAKLAEVREQMEKSPTIGDADAKKDVRFLLGLIAGLKWRAELIEGARKMQQKRKGQEHEK